MAKKVDDKMFYAVKILVENGATLEEASKYMKIAQSTVSLIKKAETYEEYKQMVAAMWSSTKKAERKAKKEQATEASDQPVKVIHEQSVTIQATHYMMTEMQKTNELLKAISSKLAFIVDELCGTTKGA